MDWDKKWEEHVEDMNREDEENGAFYLAVLCQKCQTDPRFCTCAKERWIGEEKEKLGIPVEKPHQCGICKQGMFKSMFCKLPENPNYVHLCYPCFEKQYGVKVNY